MRRLVLVRHSHPIPVDVRVRQPAEVIGPRDTASPWAMCLSSGDVDADPGRHSWVESLVHHPAVDDDAAAVAGAKDVEAGEEVDIHRL